METGQRRRGGRTQRAGLAGAAAAVCLALAACDGGDDSPEPITGRAKQVATTVRELERATARREFKRICEDLFSAAVRRQAGGAGCPALLRRTAGDVRNPRIAIEEIRVRGRRATARVSTRARGQAETRDEITLVRERGRYRIASLSG